MFLWRLPNRFQTKVVSSEELSIKYVTSLSPIVKHLHYRPWFCLLQGRGVTWQTFVCGRDIALCLSVLLGVSSHHVWNSSVPRRRYNYGLLPSVNLFLSYPLSAISHCTSRVAVAFINSADHHQAAALDFRRINCPPNNYVSWVTRCDMGVSSDMKTRRAWYYRERQRIRPS